MNQRYILRTTDRTQYHLIQKGLSGPWTLVWGRGPAGQKGFPLLSKALFCLGGIVEWPAWDLASKETLLALNNGQSI